MPKAGFLKCFGDDKEIYPDPDFGYAVYAMTRFFPRDYTKYQIRYNFLTKTIKVIFEMKNGLYKISESYPKSEAILR